MQVIVLRLTRVVQCLALCALSVMSYVLGLKAEDAFTLLQEPIVWLQHNADWIGVVTGLSIVTCEAALRIWATDSREQKLLDQIVQSALNRFCDQVFPDNPETEPADHNRVTIFRRSKWKWRIRPRRCFCWPWGLGRYPGSGWLVVVGRSGHATKLTNTVFLAPDDATAAEGVSGKVWRVRKALRIRELPDLNDYKYISWPKRMWLQICKKTGMQGDNPQDDYDQIQADVTSYAVNTGTSEKLVWDRLSTGPANKGLIFEGQGRAGKMLDC